MDARATESAVAKRAGLSKQLTHYRIKRLEQQGILKGTYAIIDHGRLGIKFYRVALKLGELSKEKKQEILAYLVRRSGWIVSVLGPWDLWLSVYVEDDRQFMAFWREFYERYGTHVKERWISLITRFWNYERSFLLVDEANRDVEFKLGESAVMAEIDGTDRRVLQALTKDARQSSLQLARTLKVSERIVRYRIKRLEQERIILGYRTFIDTAKLGFKFYKVFVQLQDAGGKDWTRIRTYAASKSCVAYATEAINGYDFELECYLADSVELYAFMNDFRTHFASLIKEMVHMEYMEEHKISFYPL
jgi:DNA-binding Lrp family transcriptional regulator